ncbi:MAG: PKD domain-containing protein, partial [Gammaproteobacteria bacterium]|nr:PKD domain-containing protein [Gammaproteobacteria bacterium]
ARARVEILNVPPVIGPISVTADLVPIGTQITASADFTDGGEPDTHTATWDWGDSSTSTGTVTQGIGSGSVFDPHTYDEPGVYTITLTLTDDDGGSDTAIYQFVVVYDPDGSFVTGGGTIDSPPGAYLPDTSLTGMANFGFVSKYKKGANVPMGHTEFQFHAAGMDFKSTDYQWLVVAGPRAQFKGTGTIKDMEGSYKFFLTAIDGEVNGGGGTDKFRIKIWDAADDDNMIYDNQVGDDLDADPTTVISSGSIVIHSKGKK